MKNKVYLLLFMLFAFHFADAQTNYYYYYKGQKIYLTLDKKSFYLFTNQNFEKSSTADLGVNDYDLTSDNSNAGNKKIANIEFTSIPNSDIEYYQKLNTLKQLPNVDYVGLFFKRNHAPSIGISKYFYVKLKNLGDYNLLQQIASQKNAQIIKQVPYMPKWYILSTSKENIYTSLDLCNQFYETGLFDNVDPAFMFNFGKGIHMDNTEINNLYSHNNPSETICANDPEFYRLWGLENGSDPNIDINACQAWTISQGTNVNIAVIDQGIYKPHNDLSSNISSLSYDAQTNTFPSVYIPGNEHGTHIAGTIAAIKDNNLQVVGVAPQSKIISVSHDLYINPLIASQLASGFSWAMQNGADIISNSWGDQGGEFSTDFHTGMLEEAIIDALTIGRNGKGCIVTFAAGNWSFTMDYPGNFDDRIITVGSVTKYGDRADTSGYGTKLDIVAPGEEILSTIGNNQTGIKNGTSMAAPHVSGIAALILSINPCLTRQQVSDIIEKTSQKVGDYSYTMTAGRPNGTWNEEMGYGLVDAYAAVQMSQSMTSSNLDLYIKDSQDDLGIQPNPVTQYMWTSDDIWVRNINDNGLAHQNPDYSANGNPNYVKVRVINKSCYASIGNEQLKLYWAKAATALAWPNNWNGNMTVYNPDINQNVPLGGEIGALNIPILQPGEEVVLSFPWHVPNPAHYDNINTEPWHFCLLSRIVASNDPMTFAETWDVNSNARNNNNIAWKNVTVVDVLPNNVIGGVIAVGNPFNTPKSFYLEMVKEDLETGKPIYEEAEIGITMDDTLYQAWQRGGNEAQLLEPTLMENKKIVKGNNVILDNLYLEANERGTLYLSFNFLTREITGKTNYRYHVIQKETGTGKIIGGETYVINKRTRTPFVANANDKLAELNQPITIDAEDINEPAIYNWYDDEGNLIFEGKNLQIANAVAKKYKLEVISALDGYKDYREIEVKLKPSQLKGIAPNPANSTINVNYKLSGASSAYLMIIGYANGISNNYILDVNLTQTTINVNNYQSGVYTVALIVNGEIVDAKTLIKE